MVEPESPRGLPTHEDRASFEARIEDFDQESQRLILYAYDTAKNAHRLGYRRSQERYFEHSRSVALILLDECHIIDPDLITAAFLHDTVEDTSMFGSSRKAGKKIAYSSWTETARWRISRSYNPRVADLVIAVTTPKVELIEIPTEEDAMRKHVEILSQNPDAILLKMADRLHNLRTMGKDLPEQQEEKIKETEEIYYPLFDSILQTFPEPASYLLTQIKEQIVRLREKLANPDLRDKLFTGLSKAELQVMYYLVKGMSDDQVRIEYGMDVGYLKQTRIRIQSELGTRNDLGSFVKILDLGLMRMMDVDQGFDLGGYYSLNPTETGVLETLADPRNYSKSDDQLGLEFTDGPEEFERIVDELKKKLNAYNRFQFAGVLHYIRVEQFDDED
ncbi:MAG: HD domain-containing protein [Patescibacteria group bacterium]